MTGNIADELLAADIDDLAARARVAGVVGLVRFGTCAEHGHTARAKQETGKRVMRTVDAHGYPSQVDALRALVIDAEAHPPAKRKRAKR